VTRRVRGRRARLLALGFPLLLASGLLSAALPAGAVAPPITVAVLGDTPYSATQRAQFPNLVSAVNADPAVSLVLHAGDVKDAAPCDDARLADRATLYGTFADPFVITPGDNEWTDCHRMGRYLPTERLETVRRLFFPVPGLTLGRTRMTVASQRLEQPAHAPYVENVRFTAADVVFATVHVVGSGNDLTAWSGLVGGDRPVERKAEFDARRAANLAWINATFDAATRAQAPGVVLMLQAEPTGGSAYTPERTLIAQRSAQFKRPVLLIHGDEHRYEVQKAYAGVANLTRLETYGNTATYWLALRVDPSQAQVFSWQPRRVG
jgi:Calcineurin-like phosphoesterase